MEKKCGYVALAGRPNAGKSTFLNRVLKEKVSIVSDKPQTTRNKILGVYHGENIQIGFLDLPGIHKPKYRMNRMMMRAVNNGLDDADLILHFIDMSVPSGSGDRYVDEFLKQRDVPLILVLNKMDLVNKTKALPKINQLYEDFSPEEVVPVSAKTGENLDQLLEIITRYIPAGEFLFDEDDLTDQPLRFMASEAIRENVLHLTREEVPHAVAVTIETFEETEEDVFISALILVERSSQRRILLGSGGSMISKLSQQSRRALRKLLHKAVELELYVKVQDKWRNDDQLLGELNLPDIQS